MEMIIHTSFHKFKLCPNKALYEILYRNKEEDFSAKCTYNTCDGSDSSYLADNRHKQELPFYAQPVNLKQNCLNQRRNCKQENCKGKEKNSLAPNRLEKFVPQN